MLIIFDLDNTLFDTHAQIHEKNIWNDVQKITLFPGVQEFLESFSGKKILVSHETIPGLQQAKIDQLQIEKYFNEIVICSSNMQKKEIFGRIRQEFPQKEIMVIGDRVDCDIRYGRELGLKTIWFRNGKYKDLKPKDEMEIPDHTITSFAEVNTIIK